MPSISRTHPAPVPSRPAAASLVVILWIAGSANMAAQAVEGRIIGSIDKEPINGATVEIAASQKGKEAYSATTDFQGRFRIEGVQDGDYLARYSALGYKPTSPEPLHVVGGAAQELLEVALTPGAIIAIHVVDSEGAPVRSGMVRISTPWIAYLKSLDRDGRFKEGWPSFSVVTLAADPSPGLKPPGPDPVTGEPRVWAPTYYPGVTSPETATKLNLKPGELYDVEIKLVAVRANVVRGRVLNLDSSTVPGVTVVEEDGTGSSGGRGVSDDEGTFQLPGVLDGQGFLYVETERGGSTLRATQRIGLHGKDQDGIMLYLAEPFSLHGRVVIEHLPDLPGPAAPKLHLYSRDSSHNSAQITPGEDGNFRLDKVYPGSYVVGAPYTIPGGYYLDRVQLGNDTWPGQGSTEIQIISGGSPVTLVYKAHGGKVFGTVDDCKSGQVVLVGREGWVGSGQCDAKDQFEITDVRPGEYVALALQGGFPANPASVRRAVARFLSQATTVSVHPDEAIRADLTATLLSDW